MGAATIDQISCPVDGIQAGDSAPLIVGMRHLETRVHAQLQL
jgi:hypothetical protein